MPTYRIFPRAFTDNRKYAEFDKIPYIDSLAFMAQDFLFSDKAKKYEFFFRLGTRMNLFDFMTLVVYFISASVEDFGRATIKGYIKEIKQYKSGSQYDTRVEYTENNELLVTNAQYELVIDLLWVSHVYATFRYELSKDDFWRDVMEMLYSVMAEESSLEKMYNNANNKENFLQAHREPILTMLEHMQRTQARKSLKTEKKEVPAANDSKKESRIAELESELEKAKKQVADLEKQNKEQKDNIELLSTDIPEIDAQQKVRMELARKIMSEAGMNAAFMDLRGRKTKVATIMGTLLGIPTHTCASWLSRQELNRETHQKSIKEINDIFEALGLPIRV